MDNSGNSAADVPEDTSFTRVTTDGLEDTSLPPITTEAQGLLLLASILQNSTNLCHPCRSSLLERIISHEDTLPSTIESINAAAANPESRSEGSWNPLSSAPQPISIYDNTVSRTDPVDVAVWLRLIDDKVWWERLWPWWLRQLGTSDPDPVVSQEAQAKIWYVLGGTYTIVDLAQGRDMRAFLVNYAGYVQAAFVMPTLRETEQSMIWSCECKGRTATKMRVLDRSMDELLEALWEVETMAVALAVEQMDPEVRYVVEGWWDPNETGGEVTIDGFMMAWDDMEGNERRLDLIPLGEAAAEQRRLEREATRDIEQDPGWLGDCALM